MPNKKKGCFHAVTDVTFTVITIRLFYYLCKCATVSNKSVIYDQSKSVVVQQFYFIFLSWITVYFSDSVLVIKSQGCRSTVLKSWNILFSFQKKPRLIEGLLQIRHIWSRWSGWANFKGLFEKYLPHTVLVTMTSPGFQVVNWGANESYDASWNDNARTVSVFL